MKCQPNMVNRTAALFTTLAAALIAAPAVQGGVTVFGTTGWQAEWDASLDNVVDIDFIEVIDNTIFFQKSAQFTQPPIGGFIQPIIITFRQIGPSTITNFVIDDEIISNHTGTNWTGFAMQLLNGGATVYDPAMSASSGGGGPIGFSVDPFTIAVFADSNRTLNIFGGILANGEDWYPGGTINDGQLWINVQSGGTGEFASFDLAEGPGDAFIPAGGEDMACRVTGGGTDKSIDHALYPEGGLNRYTWGGQAGAPTAAQPQPYGEWTHRQHSGPAGKWTFRAGTASSPAETEIDLITCCDPGYCHPARPAPAHQIDFQGVGAFKNVGTYPVPPGVVVKGPNRTFHWFTVHIEDAGEPGSQSVPPGDICPEAGFNCAPLNCDCPDFYRITIYQGVKKNQPLNTTDKLYEVYGYINGGNFQIHPPIGDVDNDQVVGPADLQIVMENIGTDAAERIGDVDGNGVIDTTDVSLVLAHWGEAW